MTCVDHTQPCFASCPCIMILHISGDVNIGAVFFRLRGKFRTSSCTKGDSRNKFRTSAGNPKDIFITDFFQTLGKSPEGKRFGKNSRAAHTAALFSCRFHRNDFRQSKLFRQILIRSSLRGIKGRVSGIHRNSRLNQTKNIVSRNMIIVY